MRGIALSRVRRNEKYYHAWVALIFISRCLQVENVRLDSFGGLPGRGIRHYEDIVYNTVLFAI